MSASRGVSSSEVTSRHSVLPAVRGIHALDNTERRSDFILFKSGTGVSRRSVSLVRVVLGH